MSEAGMRRSWCISGRNADGNNGIVIDPINGELCGFRKKKLKASYQVCETVIR